MMKQRKGLMTQPRKNPDQDQHSGDLDQDSNHVAICIQVICVYTARNKLCSLLNITGNSHILRPDKREWAVLS